MAKKEKQSKNGKGGIIKSVIAFFRNPSSRYSVGSLAVIFMVLGVVFWGGFNWSMEVTNTEEFCISCHEMKSYVYEEYKDTIHYSNRTGVRATCPDCHVPKEWGYKMIRKMYASNELYHHLLKSIDTPEKFEAKRWEMANRVWDSMRASDSRECRNCHDFESMDLSEQDRSARKKHAKAPLQGKTCIDCHKGLAHDYPDKPEEEESAQ